MNFLDMICQLSSSQVFNATLDEILNFLHRKRGGDILIRKRNLTILTVAVVSVLLGSLHYSNLTLADRAREPDPVEVTNFPLDGYGNLRVRMADNPLQEFKDAVELKLFIASSDQMWFYLTTVNPGFDIEAELPFTFTPQSDAFNVTKIWLHFMLVRGTGEYIMDSVLNISLNQQASTEIRFSGGHSQTLVSEELDSSLYTVLKPGINVLKMSDIRVGTTPATVTISSVSLFIEYKYLA